MLCTALQASEPQMGVHPWKGARVAVFGDSVSDLGFRRSGVKHYFTYLEEWLGLSVYDYAISGREWNDIPRQCDALFGEHGGDVDAILVLMGTNDFNHGIPLGEFFEVEYVPVKAAVGRPAEEVVRAHRVPVLSDATYKGRINKGIAHIREKYPDIPVVLMTLPHRGYFYAGDNNVQPDEFYPNSIGHWVDEYSDALREAGRIWSLPVVDLEAEVGYTPMLPSQTGFYLWRDGNDSLHPNALGHERMAKLLYYRLLSVPMK